MNATWLRTAQDTTQYSLIAYNVRKVKTELTVLKHPLHIEAVSGTCLIVRTPLQVRCQLPRSGVVDHPRVVLAYGVCVGEKT